MKSAFKNSLLKIFLAWPLLLWHGPAAAMSRAEFLSSLRDMGMLGFQRGTISKQEAGESSFLDAVEKEDAHLLQQRIKARLQGPFTEFMKDLHAVDEKGQNVFHALAGAEKSQESFADVMESLIRISGYSALADRQKDKTIEAANVIISMEPNLESSSFIQAIEAAGSRTEALTEIEKFIAEKPAAAVISYLHSQTTRPPPGSPYYNPESRPVYKRAFLELLLSLSADPHYHPNRKLLESINIHQPHRMRDSQGLLPRDIAKKSGNLPVFSLLYDLSETEFPGLWTYLVWAAAASGGFAGTAEMTDLSAAGSVAMGVAWGGLGLSGMIMCRKSFTELPVRFNKLLKPVFNKLLKPVSQPPRGSSLSRRPASSQ